MSQLAKGVVLLMLVVGLVACASTTIRDSWRDPSVGRIEFKKVLAMVISADATLRRVAEDELVRQMQGIEAVASYTLLTEEDSRDLEKAKAKVTAAGFDGVVTMRLIKSEKQVTLVPGAYATSYPRFWGYYGHAWPISLRSRLLADRYYRAGRDQGIFTDGRQAHLGRPERDVQSSRHPGSGARRGAGRRKDLQKQGLIA